MRRPVNSPYTISTEFGVKDSYAKFGFHSGVDYAVATGTPIYAPASGELQNIVSPTGGNMVVIWDGQFYHRLMHNSAFKRSNGRVNEGDLIALAGATGLATGPHCHWDINNEAIYPTAFSSFVSPADFLAGNYQVKVTANQRIVSNSDGVNGRSLPSTSGAIAQQFPANEILDFKGYVVGEDPYGNGNKIWFVGAYSGNYFYSGAFSDSSVGLLPNLTVQVPAPTPPTTPPPTVPKRELSDLFPPELASVTKVIQVDKSNFEVGNFPAQPLGVVIHDWGTLGVDTLSSVQNQYKAYDTTAPHLTISGTTVLQSVSFKNRAYHAGPNGNNKIGIEVDPIVKTDPVTQATLDKVLREIDVKFGRITRHLHSEFMPTTCGDDIPLNRFTLEAMYVAPKPVPEVPVIDTDTKDKINKIYSMLLEIYNYFKGFGKK